MKSAFDAVAISVATNMKSEPESGECGLEVVGVVDEKHSVVDVVFLAEFP